VREVWFRCFAYFGLRHQFDVEGKFRACRSEEGEISPDFGDAVSFGVPRYLGDLQPKYLCQLTDIPLPGLC
jgi:hypothetical protein